jgi:hypothetical protein
MVAILGFAVTAAFNPRLLAAITAMLQLSQPRRVLFWYLLGAMFTSFLVGVIVVFVLSGSVQSIHITDHLFNPLLNVVIGCAILGGLYVVVRGRNERLQAYLERRRVAKSAADQPVPKWQQILAQSSAGTAFVLGALLTLPGASYLAGLSLIARKHLSWPEALIVILVFDVIMLALLELSLVGSILAPDHTKGAVERVNATARRHGARVGIALAFLLGSALALTGVVELVLKNT